MTSNISEANWQLFVYIQYCEVLSTILHLLGYCLLPKIISIFMIQTESFFNSGWDLNSKHNFLINNFYFKVIN